MSRDLLHDRDGQMPERPSLPTRDIIDDELIRKRIRDILGEQDKPALLARLSKHPLTTLTVGFLLTWGVGTILTGQLSREREERQRRLDSEAGRVEANVRGMSDFAKLLDERSTRAEMLISSLARHAHEELELRMREYSEATVQWRANTQTILFTIRRVTQDTFYTPIEAQAEVSLERHYASLDTVLFLAYDRRASRRYNFDEADARRRLRKARTCSVAMIDGLFRDLARQQTLRSGRTPTKAPAPLGRDTRLTIDITQACDQTQLP